MHGQLRSCLSETNRCHCVCSIHVARGRALHSLGRPQLALLAATAATEAEPHAGRNWASKMAAEWRSGNKAQAVRDARKAVALDPDIAHAIGAVRAVLDWGDEHNVR